MPSRVRVAGLIGGRAYFGRQMLQHLYNVGDDRGVQIPKTKGVPTWKVILAAWEAIDKYIPDWKLYMVRERRGVDPSRSVFNQKLLGYRRNKKKKVAKLFAWGREPIPAADVDEFRFWNNGQVGAEVIVNAPPQPARRRRLLDIDERGVLVDENR